MAGIKGKSGGARPGAGRKPKAVELLDLSSVLSKALTHKDPQGFLLAVMNDGSSDAKLRVDAAKALMPFMHQKVGESGKKDEKATAAKKAANKFAPTSAPLKLVRG